VKFSSLVSIQIFSVKNANPSFYAKRVGKRLFSITFQVRDISGEGERMGITTGP
jgi:hypothetical protein